jgi:hypothetical protein
MPENPETVRLSSDMLALLLTSVISELAMARFAAVAINKVSTRYISDFFMSLLIFKLSISC